MLDFLEEAIRRQEAAGGRAEVILLHPEAFRKVWFALIKLCPQLYPTPTRDRFMFNDRMIVKHKYLPLGNGYVVDLDQAEKMLGYRPKF